MDYDFYLAPFFDQNNDGYYKPSDGDYPYYDLNNSVPCHLSTNIPHLYGDKNLWWVYNDNGNTHTESDGASIGMEIRAQVFAFATNDDVNNMTFNSYELINRSSKTLYNCYFGVVTSADLGDANDDFVGTDVQRGLGYLYNADDEDGTGLGNSYGLQPPAIGIDFLEGPYKDADGSDFGSSGVPNGCDESINGTGFNDGIIDNERLGMRSFLYYNCSSAITGSPKNAAEIYNFLRGLWRDGTPMTYGGTGYGGTIPTTVVFPDNTDPCGWATGGVPQGGLSWTESHAGNTGSDREFLQSSGPFTLEPGAVNNVTFGVVWARALNGGAWASVAEVQRADDIAQALFENCFRVVEGPNAPELNIIELDRQLLFHISNIQGSNNYQNTPEDYHMKDPYIACPTSNPSCDPYFTFQGYQVFQLKDQTITLDDLGDITKAKLVFQCDKKDTISKIKNYEYDYLENEIRSVTKVNGANEGIQHSFTLIEDAFATGDKRIVNHKTYYYMAIAYAYNNFKTYNPFDPYALDGQKKPYLASKNGAIGKIKIYAALPHISSPANNGTILNSQYGDGPKIIQLEGHGNGNNELKLTQKTMDEIMSGYPWKATTAEYENGFGPIKIKVIDPLNVPAEDFELKFIPDATTIVTGTISNCHITNIMDAKWMVYKLNATSREDTVWSDSYIKNINEQIIPKWGISITINQIPWPASGNVQAFQNGYISSSVEWSDPNKMWLYFRTDEEGCGFPNWIRCGSTNDTDNPVCSDLFGAGGAASDPEQFFEKVVDGTWAPYTFAMEDAPNMDNGVAYRSSHLINPSSKKLNSVQIVITKDKTKWSRCPVIEMCNYEQPTMKPGLCEGAQYKFGIRRHASVDKNGVSTNVLAGDSTNANYSNFISSMGMGWFPGYAIDITTGERLNISFGEDSRYPGQNGADMIWNPTNNYASDLWLQTGGALGDLYLGGKHVIYVWGHNNLPTEPKYNMVGYDDGKYLWEKLSVIIDEGTSSISGRLPKGKLWQNAMWVSIPILSPTTQMQTNPTDPYYFIKCDVKVTINVANPYQILTGDFAMNSALVQNNNLPYYAFSLKNMVPVTNNNETAKASLDLIRIVPNPYYGYSGYENAPNEKKIKFTNLPQECTISIYNVSGTLVRRIKKNNVLTYQEWNLENEHERTIASGVYIIHIDAPGLGERILKWFGAIRPLDEISK